MEKYLSIPIRYSIEPNIEDERFLKLKIYVMHDGINLNNSKFTMEAIEKAKDTLKNIPILAYIKKNSDTDKDFTGHEVILRDGQFVYLEQPVGLVPEQNDYHYEEIDGRTYVVVTAYVWKMYCQDAVDILVENQDTHISMEIFIKKAEYDKDKALNIMDYTYTGITLLGRDVEPGMIGAHAEVFSRRIIQMLEEFKKFFRKEISMEKEEFIKKEEYGTGDKIEIDLSKEAADFDTPWGNIDKTKLRNDILKASNYKSLVNACYLMVLDGWEDAPSEKLKYPVCMIKGGKLVLSAKGCQAALSYLEKNTDDPHYSSAKAKLKKYYKRLGLDTSNFHKEAFKLRKGQIAQYALTYEQLEEEIKKKLGEIKFVEDGFEWLRFIFCDYDDKFVYAYDCVEDMDVKIPYTLQGDEVVLDLQNVARVKYVPVDWEDSSDDEEEVEIEEFSKKLIEAFKEKYEALINEKNSAMAEKDDTILNLGYQKSELEKKLAEREKELEELRQFKQEIEAKERKEKVEALFAKFANVLSKDEIDELRAKEPNYDSFESFEKDMKAFVCDKLIKNVKETMPTFSRMAIVDPNNNDDIESSDDIWDRLNKHI